MLDRKLRVATVGTGYFSQFHYDAWSRCPEVSLIAVCDLDLEKARSTAAPFGASAHDDAARMLDRLKPDLLDIITPPQSHLPLISLAAERGINVVCQKPFCGSLPAARQAVETAAEGGIDLTVHENFRFQPWYRAIRRLLDEKKIGQVYQATFRLRPGDGQGPSAYLERQPYFQTMERFVVHETAVHYVDVFRFLLGGVTDVIADLARLNPVIAGEDACLILLNFACGARGVIDGNRLADHAAQNRRRTMGEMLIEGSEGTLELDGDAVLTLRRFGSNEKQPVAYDWREHGFGADCVYLFTRHLVDHYVTGTERENDAREYLANLDLEERIYQSAEKGMRIAVT